MVVRNYRKAGKEVDKKSGVLCCSYVVEVVVNVDLDTVSRKLDELSLFSKMG